MLVVAIILSLFNVVFSVFLYNKYRQLRNTIGDHNVMFCKLMYHVSKDIEDYETAKQIKDKLGKLINLYKLSE
jgi:hypothetical protein